ncbi:phosphoribosylanthranilate isomerase [Streptococcus orisasini]|uniref:phosphoribosylanthranilate isomerase n=1 Tax=Streptococcus orisasini TaxID=1080071 RepID=UPI00070BA432|nr:phosphoribosylanthranilate isomerase [Streptococcus orisasini]
MTKVKICGLSNRDAVLTAVKSGADYIGFVFAPSKRQVSLEKANELAKDIPASVQTVGVFVSPNLDELEKAVKTVPLDLVQVHGDFDEELINQISVPMIRAIQVTAKESVLSSKARYLLFDAPMAGSGETFDWQLLRDKSIEQPFFIAGGLNADNVKECIHHFSPYAVDVSSGVETDGQKDSQKIIKFIESVKK